MISTFKLNNVLLLCHYEI